MQNVTQVVVTSNDVTKQHIYDHHFNIAKVLKVYFHAF